MLGEESGRFRSTVDSLLSKGATRIVVSLYDVKSIDTSGLGSLKDPGFRLNFRSDVPRTSKLNRQRCKVA